MNFEIKIKEKSFYNKHDKSEIKVLKNINIKISSNEFVCIVGPSGCGKTTLMNMIGGLIETKDQIINSKSSNEFSSESFGYVFQTSRLLPWLTVKENVELVCENESTKNLNDINFLLENFGLGDFQNYYPKAISGGMRMA